MKKKFLAMMICGCMALTACGGEKEGEAADATPTVEAEDGKGSSQGGGLLSGGIDSTNPADNGTAGSATGENGTEADTTEGAYWAPQGTVVLGDYLGIEVDKVEVEVTDAEVQEEIDYFLYYQAELKVIEDRTTIEEGDIVNLDYTLTVGEKDIDAYDGYEMEVGAGDLPELDAKLIGCEVGKTESIVTTIEDEYVYPDYVGQTGTWTVTINAIQERVIPELTDELILWNTEYSSVEEYKEGVYNELYASKAEEAENEQIIAGFEVIIANSEFSGLSDADVQSYVDETLTYYKSYASMYGIDLESFISIFAGTTYEEFVVMLEEEGEYVVKQNLILEAVLEAEGLELTEQEYTDGLTSYAAEYGYETPEELLESAGEEEIRDALLLDKAYNFIADAMVVK